ncbi:putative nucleoredoxin 1 [Silene latifolia]|uniref:putative nucleoredoxin 1 n=1 Tax=Silene latifolia TaxID=37657 RepID=UPI003D774EF5
MEEEQPSFLLRGTPFDLTKFLIDRTGDEFPALVRNDNEIVNVYDVMNRKVVMLCFFSLPLSSHAVAVAQAVSLVSSEMHDFGAFELIIFIDCFTDFDDKNAAWSDFMSSFPSYCLTPKLTRRLGAAMPLACYPHGLLVNRAQTVEWHKPLDFLLKYGVDAFPFTSEWLSLISQREETGMSCKSWRSLYNFLCSMPLTFPSYSTSLSKNPGGGPGEVTIFDLYDKCVGLYLCQTGNLIPTLDNVHKNCSELGLQFEIILVYMPFRYDGDPQSFQDFINCTLKERNISWWVFPFTNWVSRRLSRLSHQDADDRLIIIDPKSKHVEFHGEAVIRHHGATAYPFSRELLVNREVERLREVTLVSLLVYRSVDYVLWMGSGFTHRVPVAALQGKTVFLYLHCADDHSRNCFDKLFSYCQMQALDPNFDMVFVGLDASSIPDIGNSCEMPWLVYPWDPNHSDYVTRTIFGKGDKCSTIIAFGKDGHISSLCALRLVCASCPDFPLSNNQHNEISAELAGSKVVHAFPSNLCKHSIESRNHVKALFPLLGEEHFFPGLPVSERTKPSEMHDFYDCVDYDERRQYLASKTDYIAVNEEYAQYPKTIFDRIANIDTSNFDVISFLSADNRQYLVRNDVCKSRFEVERLGDKKWVMICCLCCPIYFHSDFSLVYRGVSDTCSELYDEYGDAFEMVLVFKMSRDFEADESSFIHMLSGFPSLCLVVPFWDSESRDFICCSLGFSSSPQGLFLRADERKVIWHKTLYDMQCYGVDTFPFTEEDCVKIFHEECRKSWNLQSLEQLFDCSSAENPGGADYYEKMSINQLKKKLVGVYLCLCGESIPMLHELHQVCIANNIEFEIVVVCCLFTVTNSDPEVFQKHITTN